MEVLTLATPVLQHGGTQLSRTQKFKRSLHIPSFIHSEKGDIAETIQIARGNHRECKQKYEDATDLQSMEEWATMMHLT